MVEHGDYAGALLFWVAGDEEPVARVEKCLALIKTTPEVFAAVEAAEEDGDTCHVRAHCEPEARPSLLSLFDEDEDDDLKKSA